MKNTFLGLGFGIILVCVLYFGIAAFIKPAPAETTTSALSDEEVISRAGELGMVALGAMPTTQETTAPLSDMDVVRKAHALGMVFPEEVGILQSVGNDETADTTAADENATGNSETTEPAASNTTAEAVSTSANNDVATTQPSTETAAANGKIGIRVISGMTAHEIAQLLYKNNVVSNANEFEQFVISKNLTKKLRTGYYWFSSDESYDSILNQLTT